jgi:hypothetical protein
MTEARGSIKNMAFLCNLDARAMSVPGSTCWSGNVIMANNYFQSFDDLVKAANNRDATPAFVKSLNTSQSSSDTAVKQAKMLKELDTITAMLQEKHRSLFNCRVVSEALIETISDKNLNSEFAHSLYNCPFVAIRCAKEFDWGKDEWQHFETRVCKIQGGHEERLTTNEKLALAKLVNIAADEFTEIDVGNEEDSPGPWLSNLVIDCQ